MTAIAQCLNGPVRAGDLVMTVKPLPCCGDASRIGRTFIVGKVVCQAGTCPACGQWFDAADCAMAAYGRVGMYVQCLIRIDPPAQPETITTDEEITA